VERVTLGRSADWCGSRIGDSPRPEAFDRPGRQQGPVGAMNRNHQRQNLSAAAPMSPGGFRSQILPVVQCFITDLLDGFVGQALVSSIDLVLSAPAHIRRAIRTCELMA
jgi:hypothetical protein